MTKTIQKITSKEDNLIVKKTKSGRIQRSGDAAEVSIEKKKYTLSELSGLKGKFKKIDTELGVDDEKNNGRSIMVNMRTSLFEALKYNNSFHTP